LGGWKSYQEKCPTKSRGEEDAKVQVKGQEKGPKFHWAA